MQLVATSLQPKQAASLKEKKGIAIVKNMLRTPAAAELLGVRPNTLEIWRHHKRGPKFYRVGRCIVYDLEDLEAFVRANGVHTIDSIQTEKEK